jgi:hypothetical protein
MLAHGLSQVKRNQSKGERSALLEAFYSFVQKSVEHHTLFREYASGLLTASVTDPIRTIHPIKKSVWRGT